MTPGAEKPNPDLNAKQAKPERRAMVGLGYIVAAIATILLLVCFLRHVRCALPPTDWAKFADLHAPAVIGLPIAATAAFVLTATFRVLEGPITFDFLGLKFAGASAASFLWIATFLSVVLALRALW